MADDGATGRRDGAGVVVAIGAELIGLALDAETGRAVETGRSTAPGRVHEGARHPTAEILYVTASDHEADEHVVVAVDAVTLAPLGDPARIPARGVNLTIDRAARHLVVTHTVRPGVSVVALDRDGLPGEATATEPQLGLGEFAHDTALSPAGDRALVVARGNHGTADSPGISGRLTWASYDDGILTGLDSVDLGPELTESGFNPRNAVFHPRLPLVYLSLEPQNRVLTLSVDGDRLVHLADRARTLLDHPDEMRERQLAGELRISADGRALYAVTRADGPIIENPRWRTPDPLAVFEGGENTVSVFSLDDDGVPTLEQRIDSGGISARVIEVVAGGTLLLAANSKPMLVDAGGSIDRVPANVAAFAIESAGRLRLLERTPLEVGRDSLWWLG